MKKVIKTDVQDVVLVKHASVDKCYGVELTNGYPKTLIVCVGGRYCVPCTSDGFSRENNHFFVNASLATMLDQLVNNGSVTVYEFDTAKELFTWLAQ